MRKAPAGFLILTLLACGDADTTDQRTIAGPGTAATFGHTVSAPAENAAVQGSLVRGEGTPGLVPVWTSTSSLGDAPIKIDAEGNVILKPGSSLFLVTEDGSKCIQITGGFITFPHKAGLPCPTF